MTPESLPLNSLGGSSHNGARAKFAVRGTTVGLAYRPNEKPSNVWLY